MCSIIGSHSKDKIKELAELNAYRGQHSHSVYVFGYYTNEVLYSHKGLGPLNIDDHDLPSGYIICHQQAPTSLAVEAASCGSPGIASRLILSSTHSCGCNLHCEFRLSRSARFKSQ
jgi:hypothetical protein